jgi:hypothetical protein
MIWLLAHPFPPISKATHRKTEKEKQVTDVKGGKGMGEEPNYTTERKPGSL